MTPQPSAIWRVLKRASVADRLGRSRPIELLKDIVGRFENLVPEYLPAPSASPSLGTFSVAALMAITVALGSASGVSNPGGQAAAVAALAPTPVVERAVAGFAGAQPGELYAHLSGLDATGNQTAGQAESTREMRDVTSRSPERPALPMPTNATESQARFILSAAEPAQASQRETGVPASVTIAQAALESSWGQSVLSTKAHNYFGIKALNGPGPAGVINLNTGEYLNGQSVVINDGFKAYHSMEESFADHGRYLRDNPRYAKCFETKDPKEFARRLEAAGYATDPAYAAKLIQCMDRFNLYAYDVQ